MMVTCRPIFTACLLLFAIATVSAQSPKADAVLAAETRRFEAMTRADTLALGPMLADELVYLHSNALQESKPQHLAAIASKKLVYEKMERQRATVRFYGKTALVNGALKVHGTLNGNVFDLQLLYTAVYRKKRGVWQLVNWQSTKLP